MLKKIREKLLFNFYVERRDINSGVFKKIWVVLGNVCFKEESAIFFGTVAIRLLKYTDLLAYKMCNGTFNVNFWLHFARQNLRVCLGQGSVKFEGIKFIFKYSLLLILKESLLM